MAQRVLLVDDDREVRTLLRHLLRFEDDLVVVHEAEDATTGIKMAHHLQPDVIVLDNNMPGLSGLDSLPVFLVACPKARVLFHTSSAEVEHAVARMPRVSFVSKWERPATVVDAALRGPVAA